MISPPIVEAIDFHGWEAIRSTNGLVEAVCVPEIGGRLMRFRLGDHDFLFMNPDLLGKRFSYAEHAGDGTILHWKNFGGDKTWPAPQGWDNAEQWAGPPDPVLDSGVYSCETGADFVTMTSPPDPRTGLRITRKISMSGASSRLRLDLSFENVSDRTIRWSIWDVAQLACATLDGELNDQCWLYIPTDPGREPAYELMFGDDNPQYLLDSANNMLALRYQGIVGKIGVHSPAGWIAFANRQTGFVLCMQFPYHPEAEYPDDGATVECWTESPGAPSPIPIRSPGYILEAEVLSPLITLEPGDSASHQVIWSAAVCPAPIVEVNEVGCVHQPLRVELRDGRARIRGVFGCFAAGRARLRFVNASGETLMRMDLGEASPLSVLHIDRQARLHDQAEALQLIIQDIRGEALGTLATVDLKRRK